MPVCEASERLGVRRVTPRTRARVYAAWKVSRIWRAHEVRVHAGHELAAHEAHVCGTTALETGGAAIAIDARILDSSLALGRGRPEPR